MKTDRISINILFFTYAFFCFTVSLPQSSANCLDWIRYIVLNGALYLIYTALLADNKNFKPLADFILLLYIIFLISAQAVKIWRYIKIYHGQTSAFSAVIITIFTLIILSVIEKEHIIQLSMPLFSAVIILLLTVMLLNIDKFNGLNLYANKSINPFSENITLFDCAVPYIITVKKIGKNTKKTAVFTIICTTIAIILITIFCFMSVRGNLLYSLSPLQMVFQISSTTLIRNFDALYNLYVFFSYFRSLALLFVSYKTIKARFIYFNKTDLLLTAPFFVLLTSMDIPLGVIEFIVVIIMFFGRERKVYYEKTAD